MCSLINYPQLKEIRAEFKAEKYAKENTVLDKKIKCKKSSGV